MTLGGELYFRTLVEYLTHFAGRFAVPVTALARPARAGPGTGRCYAARSAWPPAQPGDPVRFAAGDPARGWRGVLRQRPRHRRAYPDALYRFMRGFAKPVIAAHHLFGADAEPDQARQAWEAWLGQTLA